MVQKLQDVKKPGKPGLDRSEWVSRGDGVP
jgi:hypothetical protein